MDMGYGGRRGGGGGNIGADIGPNIGVDLGAITPTNTMRNRVWHSIACRSGWMIPIQTHTERKSRLCLIVFGAAPLSDSYENLLSSQKTCF